MKTSDETYLVFIVRVQIDAALARRFPALGDGAVVPTEIDLMDDFGNRLVVQSSLFAQKLFSVYFVL